MRIFTVLKNKFLLYDIRIQIGKTCRQIGAHQVMDPKDVYQNKQRAETDNSSAEPAQDESNDLTFERLSPYGKDHIVLPDDKECTKFPLHGTSIKIRIYLKYSDKRKNKWILKQVTFLCGWLGNCRIINTDSRFCISSRSIIERFG